MALGKWQPVSPPALIAEIPIWLILPVGLTRAGKGKMDVVTDGHSFSCR
jgi:hypothetical protein